MESKDRKLILSEDVNGSSVRGLIQKILEINLYDQEKEEKEVGYKREPIELIVNSFGGSVYDGFALVSVMETSKTPIHTICLGSAMSMGFIIYLAGHKRFAHRFSTFMYHEIISGGFQKTEEHRRNVKECERLQKQYDDYVLEKTTLYQEKLDNVKSTVTDWYIPAEEAVKYGIVQELV
ncbi:ClpP family protease [Virgibacillus sp. SK37]|uniref:ClpP family protease n=1 Tax=Virgibacillus sp. SK37 TaxID=403957 RepID=UPI0004D18A15|nr:ATP-dependent Clp protease proteolytic subunit [Virgibacillus sp. SK37]AIF45658.1 hypothetical protein X953_18895 [Virgibacillus sp. SK37]